MADLKFKEVSINTKRIYNSTDGFRFSLTFLNKTLIDNKIEFAVSYFFGGDKLFKYGQRLAYKAIESLEPGSYKFDLETECIDLTRIPIKSLFKTSSFLITGIYDGEYFLRIGYDVTVKYLGIDESKLNDDGPGDSTYQASEDNLSLSLADSNSTESELAIDTLYNNIPVETPIIAESNDFVYKDFKMKKSRIQFVVHETPEIYLTPIDFK